MRSVGAARLASQARTASVDPKFRAKSNELEREPELKVLQPRDAVQHKQMVEMVEQLRHAYKDDRAMQNALALWQGQLMTGQLEDEQKFQFVRRFYWWLLGRGTDEDHKKTAWGRANAAVINREVSLYIEHFAQRRLDFALQLSLLAQRVPTSLLGYWLYFKYIVGGELKRKTVDGIAFWDLSDDNYLADFELFFQYFTNNIGGPQNTGGYDGLIQGAQPPKGQKPFNASYPYPFTAFTYNSLPIDGTGASQKEMVQTVIRASGASPTAHRKAPKNNDDDTTDPTEQYDAVTGGDRHYHESDISTETEPFERATAAPRRMSEREAVDLLNRMPSPPIVPEDPSKRDPRLTALLAMRQEAEQIVESKSNALLQQLLALPDPVAMSEEEKLRHANFETDELRKAAAKTESGRLLFGMIARLDQFAEDRMNALRRDLKEQSENIDQRIGGVEQTVSRLREEINKGTRVDDTARASLATLETKLRESGLPEWERAAALHQVALTREALSAVTMQVSEAVSRAMEGRLASTGSPTPQLQREYDGLMARHAELKAELEAVKAQAQQLSAHHRATLEREGKLNTENSGLVAFAAKLEREREAYLPELAVTKDRLRDVQAEHARVVKELEALRKTHDELLTKQQQSAVSAQKQIEEAERAADYAVQYNLYQEWAAANESDLREAKEAGAVTTLAMQRQRFDADYWRQLLAHQRNQLEEWKRKPKRERSAEFIPDPEMADPKAHY